MAACSQESESHFHILSGPAHGSRECLHLENLSSLQSFGCPEIWRIPQLEAGKTCGSKNVIETYQN